MTSAPYLERLAARTAATGTVLCLGLDPHPDALPHGFTRDLAGIEKFACLLVEAAAPFAAAIKPNLAFFEAFGSDGVLALERIRRSLPDELLVVADAKRGDIATTASRQAKALFEALGADAVTVNPYLGSEAIAPLIEREDRFAYVLCRTSNPGAAELQGLIVAADTGAGQDSVANAVGAGTTRAPAEPLYARVARLAPTWGPGGTVGLVVGATAPVEMAEIRKIAPSLAFLVPGIGAQGGELEAVLRDGPATEPPISERPGGGLLVSVSRGIAGAALSPPQPGQPTDPTERIAAAAREWAARLRVLR